MSGAAPSDSLVKYETPVLASGLPVKRKGTTVAGGAAAPTASPSKTMSRTGKLPPIEKATAVSSQTEDILNQILPPREWSDDGEVWVQRVSPAPATRLDVIQLQDALDAKLKERQARETGICPIRQELYSQTFDELIRQVTVNCAERGLLLLRVRDEMRMTLAAYQTLYESAIAFGMRKALQAEQGKVDLEAKVAQLEAEKRELEKQLAEQKARTEAIERRDAERRAVDERKHADEVAFLKKTNAQLKSQLEALLAPQVKKP